MGDTVGGEVLARDLDGTLGFSIERRALTNGSIYIEMAQLSTGQQLLLSLPDERNELVGADEGAAFRGGLAGTFAPDRQPDDEELDAQWALMRRHAGLGAAAPHHPLHRGPARPGGAASPARSRPTRRRSGSCGAASTRSRCTR